MVKNKLKKESQGYRCSGYCHVAIHPRLAKMKSGYPCVFLDEEDGKTPFIIDKSLRRELRSIVIEKTELLRNTYYGCNKGKSHVYNDILRLNNNFYDYHGCQLLE